MKSGLGAVLAAIAASACCLGPVAFTALGSGALAAASTNLAVVRPFFLTLSLLLLGAGFYRGKTGRLKHRALGTRDPMATQNRVNGRTEL